MIFRRVIYLLLYIYIFYSFFHFGTFFHVLFALALCTIGTTYLCMRTQILRTGPGVPVQIRHAAAALNFLRVTSILRLSTIEGSYFFRRRIRFAFQPPLIHMCFRCPSGFNVFLSTLKLNKRTFQKKICLPNKLIEQNIMSVEFFLNYVS